MYCSLNLKKKKKENYPINKYDEGNVTVYCS